MSDDKFLDPIKDCLFEIEQDAWLDPLFEIYVSVEPQFQTC